MNFIAPLLSSGFISASVGFLLFIFVGFCFGFIIEQAGFSSSKNLVGLFYGYDMRVLKTFLTAAVVAALGISYLQYCGIVNPLSIDWQSTFIWGVVCGSIVMGIGFIVGGFCPGTSLCAASIGKIDAMIFIVGMFGGMFLFGHIYAYIKPIHTYSIGVVNIQDFLGISKASFLLIFSSIAIGLFWMAEFFEQKVTKTAVNSKPRIISSFVIVVLALIAFLF